MSDNLPEDNRQFHELNSHEIAREFSNLNSENYVTVIPIGFPNAGKTLWLSSILHFAKNNTGSLFSITRQRQFPFDGGFVVSDELNNNFKVGGKLPGRTVTGTLDIFGINLSPVKEKLPSLNLALIDLAGEDISKIRTSVRGDFSNKIKAIFNGLALQNSPIIFVLITPFAPSKKARSSNDFHKEEDTPTGTCAVIVV